MEEKILNELWGLWKETKFYSLREEINRVFTSLASTRNGEKIVNNLLGRLKAKDEYSYVRNAAYSSLQKLAENQAKETSVKLSLSPPPFS